MKFHNLTGNPSYLVADVVMTIMYGESQAGFWSAICHHVAGVIALAQSAVIIFSRRNNIFR